MAQERPLPPIRMTVAAGIIVAFSVLGAACVWLALSEKSDLWLAPIIALLFAASFLYFKRRRCPQCGDRLQPRKLSATDRDEYRMFLDCKRCDISWDTGLRSSNDPL
jgi:hypothetical protein